MLCSGGGGGGKAPGKLAGTVFVKSSAVQPGLMNAGRLVVNLESSSASSCISVVRSTV